MAASQISVKNTNRISLGSLQELALYAAAALSATAAGIHLWVTPEHFGEWWGYGAFFLIVALAQGLFGVALLRWPGRPLFLLGIAGNLQIVAFYIITRTSGIPFFGPDAGTVEEVGALDLTATVAQLALIVALVVLSGESRKAGLYARLGAVQVFGVGLLLYLPPLLFAAPDTGSVLSWLRDSSLAVPLSVLAIWLATPLSRRLVAFFHGGGTGGFSGRLAWALTGSLTYATFSVPAVKGVGEHGVLVSHLLYAAREASAVLGASFVVLLAVAVLRGAPGEEPRKIDFRSIDLWRPRAFTAVAGLAVGFLVVGGPALFGGDFFAKPAEAQAAPTARQCDAGSYDRSYDVAAIDVTIPFNRWGDIDPDGQAYVLQGDKQAVKNWSTPLAADPAQDPAGNRRLRPRPLVLRANAGECVKVEFTNELDETQGDGLPNDPRASMKVSGPSYNAQTSDGAAVGFNDDTTVPNEDDPATPGQDNKITYFWQAPEEGLYLIRDMGATAGSEADGGSQAHGLYGALAVEPPGSTWTDPTTGNALYAGDAPNSYNRVNKASGDPYIDADINPPAPAKSFRESIQLAQDELPRGIGFGFNYGSEPDKNRKARRGPDSVGEETSLSSWVYGDPALVKLASGPGPWLPKKDPKDPAIEDCGLEKQPGGSCYTSNVFRTYPNDPTKVRYAMAGVKETHVFHMHANQWLGEPKDTGASGPTPGNPSDQNKPESTTIDSQTFGPGETFTADLLFGAGSKPGTFGDSIFHCHLYPHFADGFWSLMRVHDVLEDGTNKTPDGINVRPLKPLQDRTAPPAPTADNPGYPRFIPGKFGWRAPQPPGGISETRQDDPTTPEDESKDDPTTPLVREDLKPAMRIAAGQALDPSLSPDDPDPAKAEIAKKLEVERDVQLKNYNPGYDPATDSIPGGGTLNEPKPGAPMTNPCPSGKREVTYNVSVIQTPVTYNEAGWKDTQGRILVPSKDADDILAGKKEPEPLFFRANAGDCINFNLTNRLPTFFGNDAFVKLAQANMIGQHIHLVKFDVLGSDGSSNGWNYQEAAFTKEQADFDKDVTSGAKSCTDNETTGACRLPLPDPASYDPSTSTGVGTPPGQTISERWYADYELRTVFTHDHHFPALDQNRGLYGGLIVEPKGMDFRNPKPQSTGPREKFYQPVNDPANGTPCGNSCEGTATGTTMDVIGPKTNDDFREFGLSFQDFVSLTKPGGNPQNKADTLNAPSAPEDFPNADPGMMAINYKNAPFLLRQEKNGQPVDPAYTFSSSVWGDPATPVLNTYAGDPVRIRLVQGSQEEQHAFQLNGMRWREEPDDPDSPLVNNKALGVSDAPNFEVPKMTCGANDATCIGDFLYGGTAVDDLYMGMWGILRARGKPVSSLLPLPDNTAPDATTSPSAPTGTAPQTGGGGGLAPPESNAPGTPCPAGAPVKKYEVVAMEQPLKYNEAGDNDPYGLMYALASDEAAIKAGDKKPEPLVLRANEGDCIEVGLTNKLTPKFLQHKGRADGDASVPMEPVGGTAAGLRVSLNPQLVKYDVRGSDGTAVGYNRDQTVGPGDRKLYRWYADDPTPQKGGDELGATNLTNFGDVRGQRHHGLFAGLTIEPKGSTYTDPVTGDPIKSGVSADIRVPGPNNDFREFTPFIQDGLNLRDKTGAIIEEPSPIPDPVDPNAPPAPPDVLDPEDEGEQGFNYANAPFKRRLGYEPVENPSPNGKDLAGVFSSKVHGDPATPIFRAYAGDRIRMRVLQGGDKPRQNSFQISGHSWLKQPDDPGSNLVGGQSGITVGRSLNIEPSTGAGGSGAFPGDYLYGTASAGHLSAGLWGLMRVYQPPSVAALLNPTPIGATDDPRAGGHPILPLEISNTATNITLGAAPASIKPGAATTLSGRLASASGPVANRPVVLEQKSAGAASFTAVPGGEIRTDADGNFSLANVKPAKTTDYRAVFAGAPGSGLVGSTSVVKQVVVQAAPAPAKAASTVSLNAGAPTAKLGQSRVISGAVGPAHAGSVKLTIRKPGADVVRNLPLKGSRYSFTYKPPVAGAYSAQVNFAGDGDHLASASPVRRFNVTR